MNLIIGSEYSEVSRDLRQNILDDFLPRISRSDFERLCIATSALAALFHDLGKFTEWFQRKLRENLPLADAVRHELVSCAVVEAIFAQFPTETEALTALSDATTAREVIAAGFTNAFATPEDFLFKKKGEGRFSRLEATLVAPLDKVYAPLKLSMSCATPKLALLQSLILTHHRLPGGTIGPSEKLSSNLQNVVNRTAHDDLDVVGGKIKRAALVKELEVIFSNPNGLRPLWDDDIWISAVASAANSLATAQSTDFSLDLKALSIYGRTSIILGDHKASQTGNTRFPEEGTTPDPSIPYANTNREKGLLADALGSHLRRVCGDTRKATDIMFGLTDSFPSISFDELPPAVVTPSSSKKSKFGWQAEAGREARKAMKKVSTDAGFFAVMNAGTGSGKTRAAPIIMTAVANRKNGLRLNMCTGLRSLTLQAGDEYLKDMNFSPDDVSVVIGDELTSNLHGLSHAIQTSVGGVGTEADFPEAHNVLQLDRSISTRPLPGVASYFAGEDFADPNVALLSAPVLVSTIDTLMPAADARRGNHVLKTLRMATSDLVIDEIDNFNSEDIVAIVRLVHLSAAFGRKVLISSATLTPEIASNLFQAYRAGWAIFEHARGKSLPVIAGWFSNTADPICEQTDTSEQFVSTHERFTASVLEKMVLAVPKRRARVAMIGDVKTAAEYFACVADEIRTEHSNNHVVDPVTGRRISLGVVRWNNVAPSMMHANNLLSKGIGEDFDVFVIPYNGTLLPVVRHELEGVINPMLSRKLVRGKDPALDNEYVRKVLDHRAKTKDVVVVMVTTSLEEVGRDHDFDWCIVEPGSVRGLIQMAGRILRHRDMSPNTTNVCILQRCFRELRAIFDGDDRNSKSPIFAFPGVETPFIVSSSPKRRTTTPALLPSHDAAVVYDIESLRVSVDARDVLSISEPKSLLAKAERAATLGYMQDAGEKNGHSSVREFLTDPMSLIVAHHPTNRRFRRSSGRDYDYFINVQGGHEQWMYRDAKDTKAKPIVCDSLIDEIVINEDRLFRNIGDPVAARDRLAGQLWGDNDRIAKWKAESLLTIRRPLFKVSDAATTRFHYHPALGFCPKKEWTTEYL